MPRQQNSDREGGGEAQDEHAQHLGILVTLRLGYGTPNRVVESGIVEVKTKRQVIFPFS